MRHPTWHNPSNTSDASTNANIVGSTKCRSTLCHASLAATLNTLTHSKSARVLKHHSASSGHHTKKHYLENCGPRAINLYLSLQAETVWHFMLSGIFLVPVTVWCLHYSPPPLLLLERVSDPPQGGQSPVWARWWLVWVSMGLFTHYRPHRQDTVKTAYVCHVCLNYRQAMTGQLLSTAAGDVQERQTPALSQKIYYIFSVPNTIRKVWALLSKCTTTRPCNGDVPSAEGSSLVEVSGQGMGNLCIFA